MGELEGAVFHFTMLWSSEYFPLLLSAYKQKPEGVKPLYSRHIVDIALRLHITPQELRERMEELEKRQTPALKRLWQDFANPRKLSQAVKNIWQTQGYGAAGLFYEGVEINESWELDFRPIAHCPDLTPSHLIVIFDLYFRLTPQTISTETDEIKTLARQMKTDVSLVVEVLKGFMAIDPFFMSNLFVPLEADADSDIPSILPACREIWTRYGNGDPRELHSVAEELMPFFKS